MGALLPFAAGSPPAGVRKRGHFIAMVNKPLFGFVYAGLCGDRCKLGLTADPKRRRRQIETAAGLTFDQFQAWRVYAPAAAERQLHRRYDAHRTTGEWFNDGVRIFNELGEYMGDKTTTAGIVCPYI